MPGAGLHSNFQSAYTWHPATQTIPIHLYDFWCIRTSTSCGMVHCLHIDCWPAVKFASGLLLARTHRRSGHSKQSLFIFLHCMKNRRRKKSPTECIHLLYTPVQDGGRSKTRVYKITASHHKLNHSNRIISRYLQRYILHMYPTIIWYLPPEVSHSPLSIKNKINSNKTFETLLPLSRLL